MIKFQYSRFGSTIEVLQDGNPLGLIVKHFDMLEESDVWIYKVISTDHHFNGVLIDWNLVELKDQIRRKYGTRIK